ncbi:MAG: hypothetical protein QOE83_1141 [Actinomycetota bacterium]|jgi:hypothetical protein|nr:hypothetical protein [Actinomycetota bacterium]
MVLMIGGLAIVILAVSAWWGSSIDHRAETAVIRVPREPRSLLLRPRRHLTLVRAYRDPEARRDGSGARTISVVQRASVVAIAVGVLTAAAVFASSTPVRVEARRVSRRGQGVSTSRGDGSRQTVSRPADGESPRLGDGSADAPSVAATHRTPDPTPTPATDLSPSDSSTSFSGLEPPRLGGRHTRHDGTARRDPSSPRRAKHQRRAHLPASTG